ncbi:hypothetical protein L1987_81887 [Smallanthus sonchifolius]|uniref:Uncharacterized protein n=1 Tax=Smallanthus sonchifolius TaxID=185202 RepID=A0ACB8YSB6_9ASTR|nr:hypothetical protein L1987_81887 [Smallanthus sonchifolius]
MCVVYGASGVGTGNFQGVGPLDSFLKPRNLTWLRKADLLFVDSPVGSGYSFVEDQDLLAKTDEEVATDLTTLLIEISIKNPILEKKPLYILGGFYGGKFAVTLGLSTLKAIEDEKLMLLLGGIVLGDGFISPEDYVTSWGPLLKDVSRIDENGLIESNRVVEKMKQQIANGNWKAAAELWADLEQVIHAYSNFVDLTNFLLDDGVSSLDDLDNLMNGVIRKKAQNYSGQRQIYCGNETVTKGFAKSYKNLHFYWILGAGHNAVQDQPFVTFNMIGDITNSPGLATF